MAYSFLGEKAKPWHHHDTFNHQYGAKRGAQAGTDANTQQNRYSFCAENSFLVDARLPRIWLCLYLGPPRDRNRMVPWVISLDAGDNPRQGR